ncbi:kinase-like domain-containing protein, partial [Phaeosphaeria sp. MPI-PUGE-AT-0046c]
SQDGSTLEVKALQAIGKHDNIAGMLAYCGNFEPASPAIFFEVCDLGDAHTYKGKWFAQQEQTKGNDCRLPEVTVLKLLHDMCLALDFLHNGRDICYVHNDLKPENILVVSPPGYKGKGVPTEPIFKITDFARSTGYPTPPKSKPGHWSGTSEYTPPLEEQKGVPKPSVDIWSLGASIQSFVLNTIPVQSREYLVQYRKEIGLSYPELEDDEIWGSYTWRKLRLVVYRPLDVTREVLNTDWDLASCWPYHRPYSTALNDWYAMLFDKDPVTRITSAHLKTYVVPALVKQMLIAKRLALAESGFEKARLLREQLEVQKTGEKDLRMEDLD